MSSTQTAWTTANASAPVAERNAARIPSSIRETSTESCSAKVTTAGSASRASIAGTRAASRARQAARAASYLLTVAIMVGLGGPASAASEESHTDARKDLVSRDRFSDAPPKHLEPSRRLGDILSVATSYGEDLVVTTRFLNLQDLGHQEFRWLIMTSEDEFNWDASYVINQGQAKGRLTLLDPIANQPKCAKVTLDRPTRTITLSIPASCLGSPSWVRVGNGILFLNGSREYHDDARIDGAVKDGYKYGPKLTAS